METGGARKRRRVKSPLGSVPLRRPLSTISGQRATRFSKPKADDLDTKQKLPASTKPKKSQSAKSNNKSLAKAQKLIPTNPVNPPSSPTKEKASPQAHPTSLPESKPYPQAKSQSAPSAELENASKSKSVVVPSISPSIFSCANWPLVCEEHGSCPQIPWSVMFWKLKGARKATNGLLPTVSKFDESAVFQWVEGLTAMSELLNHPEVWDRDCCICAGLDFLYSKAGLPFLVGIWIMGDRDFFELCLEGVRMCWGPDGNDSVEKVQDWIEGLLSP